MPATYTFTRTREQMRNKILSKLNVISAGETPNASDSDLVYEAIDLRLKELHSLGILWYQVAGAATDVALVSGTATANAPADCLFPVTLAVRIGSEDREVELIDHRRYQAIENKSDTGEPEVCLFAGGVFRFYPVPNDNYTAKLTYQAIAADTAASTAPDIEVSMMRSFIDVVAADLCDDFEIEEQKTMRLQANAKDGLRTIRALNQQACGAGTTEAEYF